MELIFIKILMGREIILGISDVVREELNLKKKGNIYFDFSGHKQTKPKHWNIFSLQDVHKALTVGVGDPGGDGESMLHWLQ